MPTNMVPLTKRQQRLRKKYTRLDKVGTGRFWPELFVGNQSFRVYAHPAPKLDCEWMRDMLAKALSRVR